jgi:hypothetical protein
MDEALRVVLEARIRELIEYRRWYSSHLGWIPQQRVDDMAELRILLRVHRQARRLAAVPRQQPAGVGYHDWTAA